MRKGGMALKKNRLLAVLTAVMLVLTLVAPVALMPAPAMAASTYSSLTVPYVENGDDKTLGKVQIEVSNVNALTSPDILTVSLPSGVVLPSYQAGALVNSVTTPDVVITAPQYNSAGQLNPFSGTGAVLAKYSSPTSFEIVVRPAYFASGGLSGLLVIDFKHINLSGQSGDVIANFMAPSGSGFTTGAAVIAKVSSGGGTMAVAKSVKNISKANSQRIDSIIIAETVPGTIKPGTTIELKLPSGYTWDLSKLAIVGGWAFSGNTTANVHNKLNAQATFLVSGDGGNKAIITVGNVTRTDANSAGRLAFGFDTTGLGVAFDGFARINVPDNAANGEVTVDISGSGDVTDATVVVAKVGDYGVSLAEGSKEEVLAGGKEQKIGYFTISEAIVDSLVAGRSVKLTLPEGCKWEPSYYPAVEALTGAQLLTKTGWSPSGTDGRSIVQNIANVARGNDAATLKLKDAKIQVSPAFSGPVTITVSGTAGVAGEVVVAEAKKRVEMSVSEVKDVIIGAQAQATGDILIKENKKGAILDSGNKTFIISLPEGFKFASKPTVSVTEGNLEIDTYKLDNSDKDLVIKVKTSSTVASTIKISGVKVTLTRYVPEGPAKAKLASGENALDETTLWTDSRDSAGSVVFANVVTPAPAEQGRNASFFIGSTVMTVNGSNIIMDAAPYIKNGRTYVPVRYLGDALGATTSWDAATQTVTVTKGDKTVVLVIGSKIAKVNGQDVVMDVAPEISNGRTMLPARYVAEGLGYQVGWNPALKQVVIQ
jgi:hypothetical protein